jgi:hypothetical protein
MPSSSDISSTHRPCRWRRGAFLRQELAGQRCRTDADLKETSRYVATAAYYLVCYATTVRQLNRVIAITELKGNQQQKEEVINHNNSGEREQSKSVTQAADLDLIQRPEILRTFLFFIYLPLHGWVLRIGSFRQSGDKPTKLQSNKNKLAGIRRLTKIMIDVR